MEMRQGKGNLTFTLGLVQTVKVFRVLSANLQRT